MEKRIFVALVGLLCIGLIFAACGRNGREDGCCVTAAGETTEATTEADADSEEGRAAATGNGGEAEGGNGDESGETPTLTYIPRHAFTSAHFLEDLDYMLYVMQNNFALFDVAYWARGVDIYAIVDAIRGAVVSSPDMTVDEFFDVFYQQFSALAPIGHFYVLNPASHNFYINEPDGARWREWWFSTGALARLQAPHVMALYEPLHPQEGSPDDAGFVSAWVSRALTMTGEEVIRDLANIYGWLTMRGETKLADEFTHAVHAMLDGDASELLRLVTYVEEAVADSVIMHILEDGCVAYLAVNSFRYYPMSPDDERRFRDFYEEIRYFDHLIVDLRYNGGGHINWFYRAILEPNIDRTFVMEGFSFLSYGRYAAEYAIVHAGVMVPWGGGFRSMDTRLRPVAELLEAYDLPDLNLTDMERMDYGFRIRTTVHSRSNMLHHHSHRFQGKIWLLTNPVMGSAAEIAAWATRETGFATLVGDVTGGIFGGPRTVINLPNTGIAFSMDLNYVTDRYGRPLEAGTIPHIFNFEGMDALETVLALISAGEY